MQSNVSHPTHYNSGRIEVIEVIEDQKLGFHLGNAIKYICRAGKKDAEKTIEDLEKSVWYLKRQLELLKAEKEKREVVRPNAMNPKKSFDYSEIEKRAILAKINGSFAIDALKSELNLNAAQADIAKNATTDNGEMRGYYFVELPAKKSWKKKK